MKTKLLLSLIFISFLSACSSDDVYDTNSAEGAFKSAEKYEKDERFEEALQRYREVQNKHPYSKYAVEAKLRVANIQYERESFPEAQISYQLFKELHPKHPQSDYVTFRLGMSYFQQLPSTIDRDLSLAHKAILSFDEVLRSYSTSQYVKESNEKKAEAIKMLAEKEKYIADFYFIRDMYDSAMHRYERVYELYSQTQYVPSALFGASTSAAKNGDPDKARIYANKLKEKYPQSEEAKSIDREIER